ncbi:hypothetical protein M0804_013434 [Polistes exclamans]|nr:hypothetical protein M0804_013434 [Polistes exclamans]
MEKEKDMLKELKRCSDDGVSVSGSGDGGGGECYREEREGRKKTCLQLEGWLIKSKNSCQNQYTGGADVGGGGAVCWAQNGGAAVLNRRSKEVQGSGGGGVGVGVGVGGGGGLGGGGSGCLTNRRGGEGCLKIGGGGRARGKESSLACLPAVRPQ